MYSVKANKSSWFTVQYRQERTKNHLQDRYTEADRKVNHYGTAPFSFINGRWKFHGRNVV